MSEKFSRLPRPQRKTTGYSNPLDRWMDRIFTPCSLLGAAGVVTARRSPAPGSNGGGTQRGPCAWSPQTAGPAGKKVRRFSCRFSPGHGGEDGEHVRAPVKGPQQLVARLLPRAKAEVCQLVQKGLAVPPPPALRRPGGRCKSPLRQGADGRQPVPRHPHQGGAENRQQGDVLVRGCR